MVRVTFVVAVVCLCVASAVIAQDSPFAEERLGELPQSPEGNPIVGPRGLHITFSIPTEDGEGVRVWSNGRLGPVHAGTGMIFDNAGYDTGWVRLSPRSGMGSMYPIAWDPNFLTCSAGAIVIPKAGPLTTLVYAADGKRWAYTLITGEDRHVVVVDGEVQGEYDSISQLTFSPGGKHVAYVAEQGDRQCVVVDGRQTATYDAIGADSLVFSPDGEHLSYSAQRGDRWVAVTDGQETPQYDAIGEGTPRFSPDGNHLCYSAQTGDRWRMVTDGEPGPEYDSIGEGPPVFSPDGRHIAYRAQKDDKWLVVTDGEEGPRYDLIVRGGPAFLKDGSLAYLAVSDGVLYRVTQRFGQPQP